MVSSSMKSKEKEERKPSKGRQKIRIKKIETRSKLMVTYSKRRKGLFNKAAELGVLCRAEVAVIATSPSGRNIYSFGTPSVEAVVDRCLSLTLSSGDTDISFEVDDQRKQYEEQESKKEYLEATKDLEAEKFREKMIEEESIVGRGSGGFWWDLPIDLLGIEELREYVAALVELKNNLLARAEKMSKETSPSNLLITDGVEPSIPSDDQSANKKRFDFGGY